MHTVVRDTELVRSSGMVLFKSIQTLCTNIEKKKLRSTLQSGILQTVTGCKRRSRLHSHNLSMVQAYRLSCKLVEMSLC